PVLGVIAMIPAFLSVIGGLTIPILQVEIPPLSGALTWAAPIVAAWMLIGVALYFYLRARHPDALSRVGEVYGEGTEPDRDR
ncbi:MAG TPA: hypothetical protein VHK06_01235, partial [Candidatus Limnocylindria bacterium]|nr:hypothetical protein [Candidatus Limnocylindria bacterium]